MRRVKEELPALGKITMMVLCTEDAIAASRAQAWAVRALKDSWRVAYPTVFLSCSDVHRFLQQDVPQHSKDGASLQIGSERKVPQAPAKALEGTGMPLLPPFLMSHADSVGPQVTPWLMAPPVQVPFCTGSDVMPQQLLPFPPGPRKVELPQPVRILENGRLFAGLISAPSCPPMPKFVGRTSTESPAAATADAGAGAETSTDTELGTESQFQGVSNVVAKLLEFDVWVPANLAKESAAAADSKAAEAAKMSWDPLADIASNLHKSGSAASESTTLYAGS